MAFTNAATLYQGTKVNTASPAELTLMLYEGAIKFCNIAIMGIEKNDIEKARAQLGILNNYIETYEMISDEGLFKKELLSVLAEAISSVKM